MAVVPWSPNPGTTRFSRDAWMNRMAERLRRDCVLNHRTYPQRVPQPQMAVMPVATTHLRKNRQQRDELDDTYDSTQFPPLLRDMGGRLGVSESPYLTHLVNMSIDKGFDSVQEMMWADNARRERLDKEARFWERVLNDKDFRESLKYWIFDNKHIT
jgi:hypothetical protein